MKTINVSKNDVGQRLDNFLLKMYPSLTRTQISKWVRKKDIKVNNNKTENNYHLILGDVITIFYDVALKPKIKNDFSVVSSNLDIIYEDTNIIVVNKPVGLLTHNDKQNFEHDTLINRIKKYLFETKQWDMNNENQFEPSLAHRLDRNTMGCVVACKNAQSLREMNHYFKSHQLTKKYYALVHGVWNKDIKILKLYIDDSNETVKVYDEYVLNTKLTITKIKFIRTIGHYSLLEIDLTTGRKHQIRACLNHVGFPIVGDKKYNKLAYKTNYKHQCLCAYYLKFQIQDLNANLSYLNKKEFKINKIWFLN